MIHSERAGDAKAKNVIRFDQNAERDREEAKPTRQSEGFWIATPLRGSR